MKNNLKNIIGMLAVISACSSCTKTDYKLGDMTAPKDVKIYTEIVGKDATHPNGDGSGAVKISISSDYALTYKIDYDAETPEDFQNVSMSKTVGNHSDTVTHKFSKTGTFTYTITAFAYGRGATASATTTTQVTVESDFTADPALITNLTDDASKTWSVDPSVPGQLGVGPWTGSAGPDWWSAGINEKVACCNCFYTAKFTFTKISDISYSLKAETPNGAFTKTGSLTTLPGIPSAGDEGCYNYSGGTSSFTLVPASSGINSTLSTQTAIELGGNTTFIGYGATLKEYEILNITDKSMYLRVQGTETGNAWYIKLKKD